MVKLAAQGKAEVDQELGLHHLAVGVGGSNGGGGGAVVVLVAQVEGLVLVAVVKLQVRPLLLAHQEPLSDGVPHAGIECVANLGVQAD